MTRLLADLSLHTVCREAHCPNQGECFSRGTAAFLLLGPTCSRRCVFCAVDKGRPAPPSADEPRRTAQAVAGMGLEFCVLTMVTRDDLADGGAAHVASQFTLYANTRKGRRPSFNRAARPEIAEPLVARFAESLSARGVPTQTGEFGAYMQVEIHNDGPVTIWMERE